MTQAKHTPGPWRVRTDTKGDIAHVTSGYETVCSFLTTVKSGHGPEQIEVDARLICAAPELLDALKSLLLAVQSNNEGGSLKTPDQIFAEAGREAIAAIAKATGSAA